MKEIAVTGANGQLAKCLQIHQSKFPELEFVFLDREQLDITSAQKVSSFFSRNNFEFCVNCAAYTDVEKAEGEKDLAFAVNAEGVKNLAEACRKNNAVLIHISTDYVFDGIKKLPYLETDAAAPINVYGQSKLKGEQYVQEILTDYFIIRTSWVYSQFGHNFYKTMKSLIGQNRQDLNVTIEQIGTPTNANDIALLILKLIESEIKNYGLYHFSNSGSGTWFDFADEIRKNLSREALAQPQKTDHFKTKAARPENSVLNTDKIVRELKVSLKDWKLSLKNLQNSTE